MLATKTTESTSNWDFSQVLDLIRSPTYEGSSDLADQTGLPAAPSSGTDRLSISSSLNPLDHRPYG